MAATANLGMRVPTELKEQLHVLAQVTGRSLSFLALEALREYVERESWQVAAIREGIEEADAGEFATDEEVEAELGRWGDDAGD